MKTSWTTGLDSEATKEMQREFNASAVLRKRLIEIIRDKERVSREQLRSRSEYEKLSWAYLQADGMGYERALNEIISLISQSNV